MNKTKTEPRFVAIYAASHTPELAIRYYRDDWFGKPMKWIFYYYPPMQESLLFLTSICAN